ARRQQRDDVDRRGERPDRAGHRGVRRSADDGYRDVRHRHATDRDPMRSAMRTLLFATLLAACGSDSPAPSAHVAGVTPDMLTMSNDAMNDTLISISYEDSDGDLGTGTAEIHECRA